MILGIEGVLLLERHVADALPLLLQVENQLARFVFGRLGRDFVKTLDEVSFGLQVSQFGLACAACAGFFVCKECITCFLETRPDGVALFFGHRAYGLPFFLHLDKSIGGLAPIGAGTQGLGLVSQCHLTRQVGSHFFFDFTEECGLGFEEFVTSGTEAIEQGVVCLA